MGAGTLESLGAVTWGLEAGVFKAGWPQILGCKFGSSGAVTRDLAAGMVELGGYSSLLGFYTAAMFNFGAGQI